jgi:hypothetical protein
MTYTEHYALWSAMRDPPARDRVSVLAACVTAYLRVPQCRSVVTEMQHVMYVQSTTYAQHLCRRAADLVQARVTWMWATSKRQKRQTPAPHNKARKCPAHALFSIHH